MRREISRPEAVQENRQRKERGVFNAARKNPQAFWAKPLRILSGSSHGKSFGMEFALGQMVHRWKDQRLL
jgi:hypothetical protein